jgi:hypothetical protein
MSIGHCISRGLGVSCAIPEHGYEICLLAQAPRVNEQYSWSWPWGTVALKENFVACAEVLPSEQYLNRLTVPTDTESVSIMP